MEGKNLTGYPSIDKPWLKYYDRNAFQMANSIPKDKTIWDVLEEKLIQDKEITAIEYFGCKISRTQFINLVYDWAKTFKVMGVHEDEVVSIYGPFVPDVCAMTLALNVIGATGYFLKLAISPEALAEETKESSYFFICG
jgi:long-chain acyl-CoA synthetase